VTDKARGDIAQTTAASGKRAWIAPQVETAAARGANAFGGPPGAVDYAIYS
jgi:hypothetical protein